MIDEFYRDTYTPWGHISTEDILSDSNLTDAYNKGVEAYHKGVSYQFCPEIRQSKREHAWKRGWDRDYYGDVSSISSFTEDRFYSKRGAEDNSDD